MIGYTIGQDPKWIDRKKNVTDLSESGCSGHVLVYCMFECCEERSVNDGDEKEED